MNLHEALELARRVHQGQVDKAGEPYIHHVQRVMAVLTSPDEKLAAALHDVVEDTSTTLADLATAGCPSQILAAVDALTRRDDEGYEALIRRASTNPLARIVKAADLYDNSDEERLSRLPDDDAARLRDKYAKAIELLGVGDQIERWRNRDRVNRLVTNAVVTGDPDALSALFKDADVDVRFACSECGESAGRLVLVHDHLLRAGLIGLASFDLSSSSELETVRAAIQTRDLAMVRGANAEFAPFWCGQCERVWCRAHWKTEVMFDDGFYDATYGTCPAGHRQLLDD